MKDTQGNCDLEIFVIFDYPRRYSGLVIVEGYFNWNTSNLLDKPQEIEGLKHRLASSTETAVTKERYTKIIRTRTSIAEARKISWARVRFSRGTRLMVPLLR